MATTICYLPHFPVADVIELGPGVTAKEAQKQLLARARQFQEAEEQRRGQPLVADNLILHTTRRVLLFCDFEAVLTSPKG